MPNLMVLDQEDLEDLTQEDDVKWRGYKVTIQIDSPKGNFLTESYGGRTLYALVHQVIHTAKAEGWAECSSEGRTSKSGNPTRYRVQFERKDGLPLRSEELHYLNVELEG